jgi:hypothetical protein
VWFIACRFSSKYLSILVCKEVLKRKCIGRL